MAVKRTRGRLLCTARTAGDRVGVLRLTCLCNIITQVWEFSAIRKHPRLGGVWACELCTSLSDLESTSTPVHASIQLLPGCKLARWGGGGGERNLGTALSHAAIGPEV